MNPIRNFVAKCLIKRALLLSLLVFTNASLAQNMVTEVLSAGYRSSAELIIILRPLIPPPGSIGGFQNQLVVKTSAANMREIKGVLASLNKPPANLLISVRRNSDAEIEYDLAQAQIAVNSANVNARAGSRSRQQGARVSIRRGDVASTTGASQRTIRSQGRGTQQLRVLEGKPAFIRIGESVPTAHRNVVVNGAGVTVNDSVEYREFGTGFSVLARLNGEHVTLDIYPSRRERRGDGSAAVQLASTSISGTLGRWMEIAGVSSQSVHDSRQIGTRRSLSSNDNSSVYVKVERLN